MDNDTTTTTEFEPTTFEAYSSTGQKITEVDSIGSVQALLDYWSTRDGSRDNHGNAGVWTVTAFVGDATAPDFIEFCHPITGVLEFQFTRASR